MDKPVNESYNPKRLHHQFLLFRADLSSQHSWHRFEIKKEIEGNRLIEWSELFVFRLFFETSSGFVLTRKKPEFAFSEVLFCFTFRSDSNLPIKSK